MDLASAALGESVADEAERDAEDEEREHRHPPREQQELVPLGDATVSSSRGPPHPRGPTGRLAALSLRQPSDLRGDANPNAARAYLDLLFSVKSKA